MPTLRVRPPAGPESPARAARACALNEDEIRAVLRETGWGILAAEEAGQPYAVPVGYGYDGRALYIGSGPGRKLRALERNPRVCLTVADVTSLDVWVSVVVTGRVRWLDEVTERARAVHALVRQRRPGGRPGASQAQRLLQARLARIEIDEMTGRRSTSPVLAIIR